MKVSVVNGVVRINGKLVRPRARRSWLAVLRRWRRMHPIGCPWPRRLVVIQIMVDGKDGSMLVQRVAE